VTSALRTALILTSPLMALAALPATTALAQDARTLDAAPRTAVVSAFEPEWLALQEALIEREEHEIAGVEFVTGRIEGRRVVLFLSGVSMVNAAMTAQIAIDHFNLSEIVFSGIAGGVDPQQSIGDVVVPERWAQYLEAVFARETDEGFTPPSFIETPFPNYGMIFPREVDVARAGGEMEEHFWFQVDGALFETARQLTNAVTLQLCTSDDTCLSEQPTIRVGGSGVSGQAFVDNGAFRDYVFETFGANVLDMESAAVAHVAYANDVPFIAFRSVSDLAGGGPSENEMATFMQIASDNSARVVRAFLAALPE